MFFTICGMARRGIGRGGTMAGPERAGPNDCRFSRRPHAGHAAITNSPLRVVSNESDSKVNFNESRARFARAPGVRSVPTKSAATREAVALTPVGLPVLAAVV
jgi:hypothetical protein